MEPPINPVPEDLRITWSWPHLAAFLLFCGGSFLVFVIVLDVYLLGVRHMTPQEIQKVPSFIVPYLIAGQAALSVLILLFLYVTLCALRGAPFWKTLGWRPFAADVASKRGSVPRFLLWGAGLSLLVLILQSLVHPTGKVPIEELLNDRQNARLFMLMAVFLAPFFEETVFRGYLYPLFARKLGTGPGILLTGVLFGALHGAQLGWTFGYVGILSAVGVIFTFVRARTGTVFASFLMHFGYNSVLAVGYLLAVEFGPRISQGH